MQHNQGPALTSADEPRRPSLKSWWQALTFRRDSRAPSSTHTQAPAYQPRHAARDAMLAIPLMERRYHPPSGEQPRAVKMHSWAIGENSAVHPNRELSMERLRSFNRRSYSWSPLAGGSSGVGMERIGEDEMLDTSDAAAAHVANDDGPAEAKDEGQGQKTSRLHPFHAHAQNRNSAAASASTSPTPTANGNGRASSSSTYSTNPTSPSEKTDTPSPKPSNASIHGTRLRQQRGSQQAANRLMVQQLRERLDSAARTTTATTGVRRRPATVRRAKTCVSYPAAGVKCAGPPRAAAGTGRPLSLVQAGPSIEGAEAAYEGKGKAKAVYQCWEPPVKRLSSMLCPDQGFTSAAHTQSSEALLSPRSSRTSQEAEEAEVETVKAVKVDVAPAEATRVKWIDQQSSEESLSQRLTRTSVENEQAGSSRTSAEEEAEVETVKAVKVDAAADETPGEDAEVEAGLVDQQSENSIAGSVEDEQQTGEEEEEELSVDDWISRMTDGAFYREGAW